MDRQPSSSRCSPSFSTMRGLMSLMTCPCFSPTDRSMTITRRGTPICGAARPMPGAAYMVATMSSISACTDSSMTGTGSEGACRTGSPYFTMGRMGMVSRDVNGGPVRSASGGAARAPGRVEVAGELARRVAPELLQQRVREHPRRHGLADDGGGGDDAGVAALHRGRPRLHGRHVHRAQ